MGLSRCLALAGQLADRRLSPLWRSNNFPLLDSHCSTLCGKVSLCLLRLSKQWLQSDLRLILLSVVSLLRRASNPGVWTMYAGIVNTLGTLFNPAYSVSHIIIHEHYNSLTRRNDIALMRLFKPVDTTGTYKNIYQKKSSISTHPYSAKCIPIFTQLF